MPTQPWRHRPAQHFPLIPHLFVVPAVLAVATAVSLFLHSDVNAALLWSQCHAHSVLPAISRIRVLGTPACFLVSFFYAALDSLRSKAILGVLLAFVGSLLTVSTVESARRVNAQNHVVSRPTIPWLVFNLVGGALVWQLVIVPAFILAAKTWPSTAAGHARLRPGDEEDDRGAGEDRAVSANTEGRDVALTEAVAIPVAVALGFYVPSTVMLAATSPISIGVWLFFPVYVSLIRQLVRRLLATMRPFRSAPPCHLESHAQSVVAVYALPILASLLAHAFLIVNYLTKADDRKELTRSVVKFIEIDFQYIGLTLLYWVFVEVGWRVPLAMAMSSVLLGPGAGVALGWLYREKLITLGLVGLTPSCGDDEEHREGDRQEGDERERGQINEQTPLMQ
ncbi:hypothetical protein E4U43_005001 [Claviceps pusilla]|uniref:Uncharacterized protein n=1 Tax=Claviceps pusilla TaxID=123648 RepID=A0A9P7N2L7_9HYPO|nr:hypothetical protein E4U43_005001 [Claviceps pusilla]